MRIISGIARGHRLHTPPKTSLEIRPTSDRAREALFNIIGDKIIDSSVLDLFAGTGAFGLESLSRGAKHVVFVDKGNISLSLIKKNLQSIIPLLSSTDEATPTIEIYKHNLSHSLNYQRSEVANDLSAFNIIFLDPPYDKSMAKHLLTSLNNKLSLKSDVTIIAEERSNQPPIKDLSRLNLIDVRKYGDTSFWLYNLKDLK